MRHTPFIAGLLTLALALALATFSTPSHAAPATGIIAGTLDHDGLTRTYTLTVPESYDGETAVPLLIALHPFGSSGHAMRARTGLDAQAGEHGMLVVYPDSADVHWDDGQVAAGLAGELPAVDDAGYIAALIDHLAAEYAVDTDQVFLTGFSNDGGPMAYHLACTMPDRFAGVAVVNAAMWDYNAYNCLQEEAAPVNLLILLGDENIEFPPQGRATTQWNPGDPVHHVLSLDDMVELWSERNGCDLRTAEVGFGGTGVASLRCVSLDATLEAHVLHGVANNWPRTSDGRMLNQFGFDINPLLMQFFLSGEPLEVVQPDAVELYGSAPRQYRAYVPPQYDPAEPMPLVVVLHGRPGSGGGMAYLSDFNRVAREQGFIVVYPDGTRVADDIVGREWNYTRGSPGYVDTGMDDVAFLRVLAQDLAVDLNIDQDRMYVTGFSNGGFMTQRVACEDPYPWAGFASVGANLFPDFIAWCAGKPPVPMLVMHGTADESIPWDGKQIGVSVQFFSAPYTAQFWVNHNECESDATSVVHVPKQDDEASTEVTIYGYSGCADDAEVLFYVIEGGGHNLPGTAGRLDDSIAGSVNMDISYAEEAWGFFSGHVRHPAPQE